MQIASERVAGETDLIWVHDGQGSSRRQRCAFATPTAEEVGKELQHPSAVVARRASPLVDLRRREWSSVETPWRMRRTSSASLSLARAERVPCDGGGERTLAASSVQGHLNPLGSAGQAGRLPSAYKARGSR